MEIKKFTYKGAEREVVVTEDLPNYIKGWDLSKLSESEQKDAARALTKDYDMANYAQEKDKFKHLAFRNFKKSEITWPK
jgi:hypothetical protein